MRIEVIRKHLTNLKIHIDQIENWLVQANDLVYQIEHKLFNIADKEYSQKYEMGDTMEFLKEAASVTYHMIDSPPRLKDRRCRNDHIAAASFYQPDFNLKKITLSKKEQI